ncbi:MAG: hypothetical protein HW421_1944 [Ignavibacteria bacterium]|nr:hypothetical protein [Ignavibacteria bacterium]
MKKEVKFINGNKITIIDEPNKPFDGELPEEIDFSKLKKFNNPKLKNKKITVTLESNVAKHFTSSKQLNQFLKLQLKSFEKIK